MDNTATQREARSRWRDWHTGNGTESVFQEAKNIGLDSTLGLDGEATFLLREYFKHIETLGAGVVALAGYVVACDTSIPHERGF